MAVKIVLKHSATEDKRPTPGQLENGEIALNYNAAGAFLTCKDTDGNIQQVGGVKISEVAPDSPVKQTLWFQPSSLTLFVYDGNAFLPVAGGGGGGTPGSGITTIIGNNGIDASEVAGVVTLDVELAGGDDGLEFSASKLKASIASDSQLGSVKIGDAISVTGDGTITPRIASASQTGIVKIGSGIDVTGDGTISVDIPQTLTFRGSVDLNNAPTGQVQLPSAVGDAYVNSTNADPVDAGWSGIAGESSLAGDLVVWDGTEWKIIKTGGNGFDDRYLRIDAGTFNQTVASTGTTTFSGLTSHGGGVSVTGGTSASVDTGLVDEGSRFSIVRDGINQASFSDDRCIRSCPDVNGLSIGWQAVGNFTSTPTEVRAFSSNIQTTANPITELIHYDAVQKGGLSPSIGTIYGFKAEGSLQNGSTASYGFWSELTPSTGPANYNFYAVGGAPNFFAGDTYIGGNTTRNTFDLWKSTLTEEQLEQLEAGTLVAPANVSLPGDGSFARSWYYDQQDEETQAALDSGELEYPEHLAAATFTDTFALGDNTRINLNSNGLGEFTGGVSVTGGGYGDLKVGIFGSGDLLRLRSNGDTAVQFNNDRASRILTDKAGTTWGWQVTGNLTESGTTVFSYDSFIASSTSEITELTHFRAGQALDLPAAVVYGFQAENNIQDGTTASYGFHSNLNISTGPANYNFYAAGTAPNYFYGDIQMHTTPFADGDVPGLGNTQVGTLLRQGRIYISITDTYSLLLNNNTATQLTSFRQSGKQLGNISTNDTNLLFDAGPGGQFNNTSDYRIKQNIAALENSSSIVKALNPVSFEYTNADNRIHLGFIAHELQEYVPTAVTGTKDATETYGTYTDTEGNVETDIAEPSVIPAGATFEAEGTRPVYQGVDQTKIIPLLTKALQEALEKIDTLEQRLSDAGL